ncbi:MAG: hypothetical protein EPN46_05385 [Candidimonas sp.]|nr:MAG: hypothetical protein EPN77_18295 [Candidimonas sp.]TAM20501.1 MAG: hypothetical protein EPN62_16445 [Candidimonas sp.]TAM77906.1 MAG: hypothetical protein EPN46_05385 [Candidimonas sp.]
MERESLLTILLILFGGLAVQPFAMISLRATPDPCSRSAERRAWLHLWLPVMPALTVAAWLCGWALREPDPVHGHVDQWVLIGACLPFAVVVWRAALRALWALTREPFDADTRVCTVGLLRPQILFSPFLAKTLDDDMIDAAWRHEQAHARHRDPLRIWLAQLATDLQWPWPSARQRFGTWLEALELARDDEARRHGASGAALAVALLRTLRQSSSTSRARTSVDGSRLDTHARLTGDPQALQRRIDRLLAPLAEPYPASTRALKSFLQIEARFVCMLMAAGVFGALYGAPILHPLLASTF